MTGQVKETGTILDRIVAQTRIDVEARKSAVPYGVLERAAGDMAVRASLSDGLARPGTSVIAEFKRASPSRGRFAVQIEPGILAADYAAGGAIGMSVLTDGPFFQGSLSDLTAAANVAHCADPKVAVLRKDFIIDEFQILEAKLAGADAILLIVGVLDGPRLIQLYRFATAHGLDVLTEVHTKAEMEIAAESGVAIIGVNNRDLHTFTVDLATTERLASLRPTGTLLVAESGIFNRDDVVRLEACGVDGILVGESIVLADDRTAAIKALRGVES